jgi:hypothetical protein
MDTVRWSFSPACQSEAGEGAGADAHAFAAAASRRGDPVTEQTRVLAAFVKIATGYDNSI